MLGGWPKRRHFFLFLGATAAVTALTFFMLLTSESYEFAKAFVASDPRIAQVTGAQKSSRIAPFKGFRSTFGDRTGEAHFTFDVSGERGTFDVRVEMEKREGRWAVVKAQTTSSDGAATDVIGARS
jgi:Cytochrome oxidase complex assembly protein 1